MMRLTEVESAREKVARPGVSIALRAGLISAALLIPCFWQRRIQAMDLSSHIYNAWLAQQIELGKAPGLTIVPMTTNVLFDWMLEWLFAHFGADAAQRIAVSVCVLIFFWGAMAFIRAASGRVAWYLTPCLAMLAYGWVYHAGFFNFYLSLGLCLWAMSALRAHGLIRASAWALFPLAYLAHPLPPLWAAATVAYLFAHSRIAPRFYPLLMLAALGGIVALRIYLYTRFSAFSSIHQILESVAIDQFWVYGIKFCGVSVAVAIVWSFMLLRESHTRGFGGLMRHGLFQMCLLSCAAILLLPTSIDVPGYTISLSFITERMTLPYGILICAFLATCDPPQWQKRLFYPIAAVFFFLIYVDTSALNRTEQAMEETVKDLTLNDRVVSAFIDPLSRVQLWTHHVDRICLGKCISYANYEPFTRAFRVQPTAAWSPLVLTTAGEVGAVAAGVYRVKPRDLPLYQITLCGEQQSICLKKLAAGEQVIKSQLSVLPLWW